MILTLTIRSKYKNNINRNNKSVHVIAHRGGSYENPENSLTAFKHSISVGVDMLELDVHITKDNIVVITHDQNLYRLANRDVNINDID